MLLLFFCLQSLPPICQDQWQLGVLTPILVFPIVMSIPLVSALQLVLPHSTCRCWELCRMADSGKTPADKACKHRWQRLYVSS